MTPTQLQAIAQASTSRLLELATLTARVTLTQIETALSTGDRDALKANNYILETSEALDEQHQTFIGKMLDAVEASKQTLTSSAREFLDMPMIREQHDKAMSGMMERNESFSLREKIIDDVYTGEGPLKPETVEALQALRGIIREKAQEASNIVVPSFPDDEDTLPMTAAMLLVGISPANAMAAELKARYAIEAQIFPGPSDDDIKKLSGFVNSHDETFAELVDIMKEEAAGLDM